MKKIFACLLAVALCLAPLSYAAAKTPEAEPITLVTYDGLEAIVTESNADYQKLLDNIRAIEIAIQDAKDQHEQVMKQPGNTGFSTAITLQGSVVTLEEQLEETIDKCADTAAYLTYPAQKLYWAHYANSLSLDIARRNLAAMEEDLPTYQQKRALGLISQSALENYEKSIKTARDNVKSAQTKVDDNLKALADYLGIDTKISLDGAPKIDFDRITNRDLEADRTAYRLSAPDVVAKENAMESAKAAYAKSLGASDSFKYTVAKGDLEAAKEKAEKDFDDVYEKLYDSYDSYITSTTVADARETLEKTRKQVQEGLLAPNKAVTELRNYQTAVSQYEMQRISLWLELLSYEYGLIHWDV